MTATVIQFPGTSVGASRQETPLEKNEALARAMADAMRNYRNAYGIETARASILSQMYVLGIVDTPALALEAFGVLTKTQLETIE
jgi:hypothetical protein